MKTESQLKNFVDSLTSKHSLVVFVGSGGVGKTTCSIALALAAARRGKKVGLLSIDPAKRLADALGMRLGAELTPVDLKSMFPDSLGTLEAAMLDQKAVFDRMVRRFAPRAAEKILVNKLYVAASSKLGGPLEYLALARLAEMLDSKKYDFIVLDTPPDTHALDFLRRPEILAGFMENRVMATLVKPFAFARKLGFGRILQAGEKLMGGIAEVTGVQALQTVSEFLVQMQDVIAGFHKSGQLIVSQLKGPDAAFVAVGAPRAASLRSLRRMKSELSDMEYALKFVLINRCLPNDVRLGAQEWAARSRGKSTNDPSMAAFAPHVAPVIARAEGEAKFLRVAGAELAPVSVVAIPEVPVAPVGLDGLRAFVGALD